MKTLIQTIPFYQRLVDFCAQHIGCLFLVWNVTRKCSKA